jgi:hypothetical protein
MARLFFAVRSAEEQSARLRRRAARDSLEVHRLWPSLFSLLLAVPACPASAQVYSWKEAGATRISSEVPLWYRADMPVGGPRVIVTSGRRLIDDTGLSMEKRRALRHPAIGAGRPQPRNWP